MAGWSWHRADTESLIKISQNTKQSTYKAPSSGKLGRQSFVQYIRGAFPQLESALLGAWSVRTYLLETWKLNTRDTVTADWQTWPVGHYHIHIRSYPIYVKQRFQNLPVFWRCRASVVEFLDVELLLKIKSVVVSSMMSYPGVVRSRHRWSCQQASRQYLSQDLHSRLAHTLIKMFNHIAHQIILWRPMTNFSPFAVVKHTFKQHIALWVDWICIWSHTNC